MCMCLMHVHVCMALSSLSLSLSLSVCILCVCVTQWRVLHKHIHTYTHTARDTSVEFGAKQEAEEEAMVHSTLLVAKRILGAVSKARRERDIELDVRIGIGTGTCVAGTMGKLQARFHVFGPAMAAAEALERGCPRGHVHINTLVMATLRRQQLQGVKHGVHGADRDHAAAAPPATVAGDRGVGNVRTYEAGRGAGLWELVSTGDEAGLVDSRARARETETLGYWDEDGAVQASLDTASSCNSFVLLPVL